AADAPGGAELVDPGGELVGHPLPVPRRRGTTDRAAVQVGVLEVEAGVPDPLLGHLGAGEVGDVLHVGAEAGGADHRAVGAGEGTAGELLPTRAVVPCVLESV